MNDKEKIEKLETALFELGQSMTTRADAVSENLLEITCSDDIIRVYTMGVGVKWEDLSDAEKKLLYESENYLRRKYEDKFNKLCAASVYLLFRDSMDDSCEIIGYIRGSEEDVVRYCDERDADCKFEWEETDYVELTDLLEESDEEYD